MIEHYKSREAWDTAYAEAEEELGRCLRLPHRTTAPCSHCARLTAYAEAVIFHTRLPEER